MWEARVQFLTLSAIEEWKFQWGIAPLPKVKSREKWTSFCMDGQQGNIEPSYRFFL